MRIEDTLSRAARALDQEQIGFALIGGFALAAHNIVRATQDIDLLVDGRKKAAAEECLIRAGFELTFSNAEVLQFSGAGQLDTLLANREATLDMIKRAKRIGGFPVPVVSPEDIIGLKIQAYKNDPHREFRDKADIQSILFNTEGLDLDLVKKYADLFDEWHFITELLAKK